MMKILRCLLFVFLICAVQAQEPQSNREGAIMGRVVASDGQPLTSVSVMAFAIGKASAVWSTQPTSCDAEGNFKVAGLAHGVYRLQAFAPGYVSAFDQSRKYRVGETVTLLMLRGGVITGRVTDEFGEPVVGVRVAAERARDSEGNPGNGLSLNAMNSTRLTDDRGVYRIFGLEPGSYVVGVIGSGWMPSRGGQGRRGVPSYSPSSPRASAAEINLHAGEEVTGVDIRFRAGRGRSISGTISGDTQGEGVYSGISVMLFSATDKSLAGMAPIMDKETFTLGGVDDGEYEITAIRSNESMDFSFAAPRRVSVKGADLSGIELKLLKLGSISGRLVIETKGGPPQGSSKTEATCKPSEQFTVDEVLIDAQRDERTHSFLFSSVPAMQVGLSLGSATPERDGGFALKNLEAGRYWINPGLPDDSWYVRAITQTTTASPKPVDLARAGLTIKQGEKLSGVEIRIGVGAASLSGKIVPASEGAPPKRLRLFLVPAEADAADDLLRYAETNIQNDGSFEFKHFAPGKYLLHTRPLTDKAGGDDPARLIARDATERAKLRREAAAAKREIDLQSCQRVKDYVIR
jgi:hypothetical protein